MKLSVLVENYNLVIWKKKTKIISHCSRERFAGIFEYLKSTLFCQTSTHILVIKFSILYQWRQYTVSLLQELSREK